MKWAKLFLIFCFCHFYLMSSSEGSEKSTSRGVQGRFLRKMGLQLSGTMILGNGSAPGIGFGITGRITDQYPLFAGLDSGLYFFSGPFVLFMPLLATLYYKFQRTENMVPTLGLSLGPTLALGNVANVIEFAALFRPGLEFRVSPKLTLFFDARFGVIGSALVFNPHLGAVLPF